MKTKLAFSFIIMMVSMLGYSQQYLSLTDNLIIPSNSNIKIAADIYSIQDVNTDGLIQIDNASNIVIDGDSVEVNGINYNGYLVKINNSHHIRIKNFTSVNHFKYAVYITNSSNIEIESNNFSDNKVDSAGWIDVWAGYSGALGGGVMCYNCDSITIHGNIMKYQNDGVALYNSKKILIYYNDFSWNTSYGIRMFWSDSSYIHHNNAAHVNRPLTDPSDCAALLMIISNENRVEYNDLRYSGDGVFLGQYQHSGTPNNNYFAYNDCSGSPHNAIEATFADGNIYRQNICNWSQYGLWLGYSFNSVLDSNQVQYNQHSGIAIDRGYNNVMTSNWIIGNPIGIELWEGSPAASGYGNQTSHDYRIDSNYFEGNTLCITASASENLKLRANDFIKNYDGITLAANSTGDSISSNYFDHSLRYDICNNSTYDIYAVENTFAINDTNYVKAKIYDKQDNPAKGKVNWKPFTGIQIPVYTTSPPTELSEPPSIWYPYPEICQWLGVTKDLTITWDTLEKKMGTSSVHLSTGTGWYNTCSFRDTGNIIAHWNLTNYGYLSFWIKSTNTNVGAFQYFHVRIGNIEGGYYKYTSSGTALNQSLGVWKNYLIPLYGGFGWTRSQVGNINFNDINYVEVYSDSYGVGYDLWLDGVQFLLATPGNSKETELNTIVLYPNPTSLKFNLQLTLMQPGNVKVSLYDVVGKKMKDITFNAEQSGTQDFTVDVSELLPGNYLVDIQNGINHVMRKLVVLRK